MSRKLIIAVLAIVLGLSIVGWLISPRPFTSATAPCLNNLRQIDGAKQQWAVEFGKTATNTATWRDIQVYLGYGAQGSTNDIYCPHGGVYTIGPVGTYPH